MNARQKNRQANRMMAKIGLVTLLLGGAPTAQADFIQNSFGLTNPSLEIKFDEHIFSSGYVLSIEYANLGISFSPFAYYAPYGGSNISNFMPYSFAYPFSLIFSAPQTNVAFNLLTAYPATTDIYAYFGGNLVESAAVTSGISSADFYGFSGIVFDQIDIHTTYAYGVTNSAGMGPLILDSLQFSTPAVSVPEPETSLLIGVGLLGMLAARKRSGVH